MKTQMHSGPFKSRFTKNMKTCYKLQHSQKFLMTMVTIVD